MRKEFRCSDGAVMMLVVETTEQGFVQASMVWMKGDAFVEMTANEAFAVADAFRAAAIELDERRLVHERRGI